MSEMIELHAKVDADGIMTIHDQHGRRLKGVRGAELITAYNSVTEIGIRCIQYVNGQAVTNKKYPKLSPPPTTEWVKKP